MADAEKEQLIQELLSDPSLQSLDNVPVDEKELRAALNKQKEVVKKAKTVLPMEAWSPFIAVLKKLQVAFKEVVRLTQLRDIW